MLRTIILKKRLKEAKTAHRCQENISITTPVTNRDITISKAIITNTPTADGRGAGAEGAVTNIEGAEAAAEEDTAAAVDTEEAVVTGAAGEAAGAGEEVVDGTTTGKIKPTARSERRNSDFEGHFSVSWFKSSSQILIYSLGCN